jgi:hypothetical protein
LANSNAAERNETDMSPMLDNLLKISFYAGLVPSIVFVVLYGFRSSWRRSSTGRAVMALMSIIAVSYALGAVAIVRPQLFANDIALWVAIVFRFMIAAVLINMTAVLIRTQRQQNERFPHDRDPESTNPGQEQHTGFR